MATDVRLPDGWNKTVDELFAEQSMGLRPSISGQEVEWSRQYERSLLPEGTLFPEYGEIYLVTSPLEATAILHAQPPHNMVSGVALLIWHLVAWILRYSDSATNSVNLSPGIRLRVDSNVKKSDQVTTVAAVPIDIRDFERRFIPALRRARPGYAGFSLQLSTVELNQHFCLEKGSSGDR